MHFPSMIVFLVWVMVRKIEWMPQVRASLCLATFSGLIIHLLFPLMPPRLMVSYGFIDTAKVFGPDPYSLGIAKAANEFAAMPSLHVGWALLIALCSNTNSENTSTLVDAPPPDPNNHRCSHNCQSLLA